LEEEIKKRGGKVTTSISKNTSILVVSSKEGGSSKIEKAKELNIPIYELSEFREKFGI
jgi:NAD-dependent DNA ligase